ncbi:MMtag domain-containing protein [Pseudoscourfieldia marina]
MAGGFDWNEVKQSAHREAYFGASLHAAVGRYAESRDATWWNKTDKPASGNAKGNEDEEAKRLARERRALKRADERAMREALGLPPLDDDDDDDDEFANATKTGRGTAKAHEVSQMLERGHASDERLNGERTRGLGLSSRVQGFATKHGETLAAEGWSDGDDDDGGGGAGKEKVVNDGDQHRHRHRHRHRRHHDDDGEGRHHRRHRHHRKHGEDGGDGHRRHRHHRSRSRSPTGKQKEGV